MDINQLQPCATCGSTAFEEIDAMYYCSVCSSQALGLTLEVRQYEEGITILRAIGQTKKERRKKRRDTGIPWTTAEAFNIILEHQCTELERKLNLDLRFRVALFSLYAEYLAKCEIAYLGEDATKPKISVVPHQRDFSLIVQDLERVPIPVRAIYGSRERVKEGNLIIRRVVKRRNVFRYHDPISDTEYASDDPSEASQDPDEDPSADPLYQAFADCGPLDLRKENPVAIEDNIDLDDVPEIDASAAEFEKTLLSQYKRLQPSSSDESDLDAPMEPDIFKLDPTLAAKRKRPSYSGGLRSAEKRRRRTGIKVKRYYLRQFLSRFDSGHDFDSLLDEADQLEYYKLHVSDSSSDEDEENFLTVGPKAESKRPVKGTVASDEFISKRSKLIKKLADAETLAKAPYERSCISIERMTISRTLQFICLAFRVAGLNIHINDIIHWVNLGSLPYHEAYKALPEEWVLLPDSDTNMLHPTSWNVNYNILCHHTITLRDFLSLGDLPHPEITEMFTRHLFDLNLPLQLVNLMASKVDYSLYQKVQKTFHLYSEARSIPPYEVFSFCAIVAILKLLFNLNGRTEFKVSGMVREKWPGSFNWQDWYENNILIWKLINQHYYPVNSALNGDLTDPELLRSYREKLSNEWFGLTRELNAKAYKMSSDFRKHLSTSMSQAFDVPKADEELPQFTVYHYHEAKRFVASRIHRLQSTSSSEPSTSSTPVQSTSIFDVDFTQSSLDYIYDPSFKVYIDSKPYQLPRVNKKWSEVASQWPESLALLVNIGSFILNRPPEKFANLIQRFETKLIS